MATVLKGADLQKLMDEFRKTKDVKAQQDLQSQADEIMEQFAQGDAEVQLDDMQTMSYFIETFGTHNKENNEVEFTATGLRAQARYEQVLAQMEQQPVTQGHNQVIGGDQKKFYEWLQKNGYVKDGQGADAINDDHELYQRFQEQQNGGGTADPHPIIISPNPNLEQERLGTEAKNRIYSMTSDQNQIMFDRITLGVYQEMGLVDKKLNPNDMTPQQVAESIDKVKLNDQQRLEYASRFVDATVTDQAKFELVPPRILADAYVITKSNVMAAKTDSEKEAYLKRFATLASRIDNLIVNFEKQTNQWYTDPTNIMDVHDGYNHMFDVRQPDLQVNENQNKKTQEYNRQLNEIINKSRTTLAGMLEEYDRLYNLTKANPEHADELMARWKDLKERLGKTELTRETLETAAKYKFLDEKGQPIPQFLDEKGQPSLEYKEGYTIDPKGRLAQVINLSRNDVAMENVGDLDTPVKDMNLQQMLNDEVPWTFSEISIPDQVAQGIIQDPNKKLDEAQVQEFWDNIKTDGGEITDQGYQDGLDAHANKAAGFSTRLAQKVGEDKAVVTEPLKAIEDIDKLAKTRTEKQGAEGRKQKLGLVKRMLKNFGMGFAVSAGLTFLGKVTGISYLGMAVGTTLGIGNMIYQGMKWRNEMKRLGKPHGIKDFFADKRNWGPAIASGLGLAATISMATGNPGLATAFGLGAVTAGVGTGIATTYQDAINAGYTRGQALAGAIGVGASGALGALAGNYTMNSIVDYVNNNTDSNLFKHGETVETTRTEYEESTHREYNPDVIRGNEHILEDIWYKDNPALLDARMDGLMDAGLSHDEAVRYLMAFHDATDHNLGPGYFDSIGMNPDNLAALRNSINGTEVNLTPESMSAFEHFNPHISATNTVGYIDGAPSNNLLPSNAGYGADGQFVPGDDFYSTYVNHDTPIFQDVTVQTPVTVTDYNTIFTPNELAYPGGLGMFGIYEPRVVPAEYMERLRRRAGALADEIRVGNDRNLPEPVHVDDKEDKILPEPNDDKLLPPHEEEKEKEDEPVPVVEEDKEKEDEPVPVVEEDKEKEDEPVPAVEEDKEKEDEPVPVVEKDKEKEDEPVPAVEEDKEKEDEPVPVVEKEKEKEDEPGMTVEDKPEEAEKNQRRKTRRKTKKGDGRTAQKRRSRKKKDAKAEQGNNANAQGNNNVTQQNNANAPGNNNVIQQINANGQGNNNVIVNGNGSATIIINYVMPKEILQKLTNGEVQLTPQGGMPYTVDVQVATPERATSTTQDANTAEQPQVETEATTSETTTEEAKPLQDGATDHTSLEKALKAMPKSKTKKHLLRQLQSQTDRAHQSKADSFKVATEKVDKLAELQDKARQKQARARSIHNKSVWARAMAELQKLSESTNLTDAEKQKKAMEIMQLAEANARS